MKNQQQYADRPGAAVDAPVEELSVFSAAERERLQRLRRQVRAGLRSDTYPPDKRQEFVRWLVEQGKLSDH